ncbi:hypothetical protein C2U70_11920 [Bradyrhizobium guangdongense]|uniref:hypothetical protein n=1 Tax=Bradyrhizobium guangdongense TaxID=1325090 RepID=UPI00112B5C9E|nr:hypothetical protein [Bradyrhizobium guangdongense]TPQ36810.1 hypothetical protein C2U70_11920 [Bradyrhizobium guangdongense]
MSASATTRPAVRSRHFGIIGSIIGLLALTAAVLPHWVLPMIYPPPPVDKVIVDTGHRLKDRLIARAKGVEYQAPIQEKSAGAQLSSELAAGAIALGLFAIAFSVFSLIRREEKLLAGVSATLGIAAIAFEFSFFVIGALILIAIIYAVVHIFDWF